MVRTEAKPRKDTESEAVQATEGGLGRNQPYWQLDVGLPGSGSKKKKTFLLFTPRGLRHFVTAALAD